MNKKYTEVTTQTLKKGLAQKLIPVADSIRNLYTKFALRPYKVSIIKVRWSSGERGIGTPLIEKQIVILPTPRVLDLSTMTEIVNPVGLDEIGMIGVTEITGKLSDDELRFLDKDGAGPGLDEEVYYEIEFPKPDGTSAKRRFFLRSAPHYFADKFYWMIRLERSHEERDRNGDPT
jgi:hypothetical protein